MAGANGMLGRDVVAAAEAAGHEAVGLDHGDLDVTDAPRVAASFEQLAPDAVINCAAWTDVDGAEEAEDQATAVNGAGAGAVAAAAAAAGASVVYPSSDYVFDGHRGERYLEQDETGPLSAYGRSKLAGEKATAAANARNFVVRTSWLFGASGKNFVETMLKLGAETDEVKVVDDQVGSPTYTGHLAAGLTELVAGEEYGIYHLAGAGQTSWHGFAREIFSQAGVECEAIAVTTEEFPRPATRPAHAVLGSARTPPLVLPPWEQGLAEYLEERSA